jgi:hypothetical protein
MKNEKVNVKEIVKQEKLTLIDKKSKKIFNRGHFKFSKGVVAFTAGVAISGTALLTIGYLAPKVPKNVDFIITEAKYTSASMNYVMHPGSATKFMTPIMESFIGRRADTNTNSLNREFVNYVDNSTDVDPIVADAIVAADKALEFTDIKDSGFSRDSD